MFLKLAILASSSIASMATASNERLIPSPVEKLFVPTGFDDNDNAEVVLHGHYTSSCYKTGPTDLTIDVERKVIKVMPQSYEYTNTICAAIMVPFIQTIKLGTLPVGLYSVEVANVSGVETKSLFVKPRVTDSPDDFIYASADEAHLEFGTASDEPSLVISGRYPYTYVGCAIMKEVSAFETPGNVLLVLPKMELLTNQVECMARNWSQAFKFTQKLSIPLKAGEDYLLHVRVLNGNSLNRIEAVSKAL